MASISAMRFSWGQWNEIDEQDGISENGEEIDEATKEIFEKSINTVLKALGIDGISSILGRVGKHLHNNFNIFNLTWAVHPLLPNLLRRWCACRDFTATGTEMLSSFLTWIHLGLARRLLHVAILIVGLFFGVGGTLVSNHAKTKLEIQIFFAQTILECCRLFQ